MMSWLRSPNVCGIFFAPPCGKCSLARCIQLRDAKGRKIPWPVPLRSQKCPEGLPGLSKKIHLEYPLQTNFTSFLVKFLDMPIHVG